MPHKLLLSRTLLIMSFKASLHVEETAITFTLLWLGDYNSIRSIPGTVTVTNLAVYYTFHLLYKTTVIGMSAMISYIISFSIACMELRQESCIYEHKMLWESNPKPRKNTWSLSRTFFKYHIQLYSTRYDCAEATKYSAPQSLQRNRPYIVRQI